MLRGATARHAGTLGRRAWALTDRQTAQPKSRTTIEVVRSGLASCTVKGRAFEPHRSLSEAALWLAASPTPQQPRRRGTLCNPTRSAFVPGLSPPSSLEPSLTTQDGITVSEEDAHAPYTLPVALLDIKEGQKYKTGPIDFLRRCMGPYLLIRFFLLPAPLLLISRMLGTSLPLYATAVANLALADAVSNIHSFIIIATNHCGDDMYKFDRSVTPRSGSFYMRAITSSSNFRTSNGIDPKTGLARRVHGNMADLNDFMHGWLNYQARSK